MAVYNILHRGGYQKILLAQAQALTLRMIISRIQHLADHLRHGVLLHGTHIVALVEERHIKAGRFRRP